MSEPQPSTPEKGDGQPENNAPEQTPKPQSETDSARADAEKWQAMSRKNEAELRKVQKQLKEYEDRDKTELQKAADALAAVQSEKDALAKQVLRMQVASELDLPADLAELLPGDDKAHMLAIGKKLVALKGNSKPSRREAGLGGSAGEDNPLDANALLRLLGRS